MAPTMVKIFIIARREYQDLSFPPVYLSTSVEVDIGGNVGNLEEALVAKHSGNGVQTAAIYKVSDRHFQIRYRTNMTVDKGLGSLSTLITLKNYSANTPIVMLQRTASPVTPFARSLKYHQIQQHCPRQSSLLA